MLWSAISNQMLKALYKTINTLNIQQNIYKHNKYNMYFM